MYKPVSFIAAAIAAVLFVPLAAQGQSWSPQQQEVWKVVVDSWEAIRAEDVEWSDKWVHPNAVVWSDQNPMPRTRAQLKKWDRFQFENSTTLVDDFSPAGIVVQGTTAVVHYYYSQGTENMKGERRTVHGRCTDILIKEGGRWQFIAWNCGDSPSGGGN